MRVSLITIQISKETPVERLERLRLKWLAEDNCSVFVDGETENVVKTWESDSKFEPGELYVYWWAVANVGSPETVLCAMFSYTILKNLMFDRQTVEMVELVSRLVTRCAQRRGKMA